MPLSTPVSLNSTGYTNTADDSSYNLGSVTVTAGALVLIAIENSRGSAVSAPTGVTLNGAACTKIAEQKAGSGPGDTRIVSWWRIEGGTTGNVIATYGGAAPVQSGFVAGVVEITGHDTTTPIRQFKVASGAAANAVTLTFDSPPLSDSCVFTAACFALNTAVTHDTDFTELFDLGHASPVQRLHVAYDLNPAASDVTHTPASTTDWGMIGIEVNPAVPAGSATVTPTRIAVTVAVPSATLSTGTTKTATVVASVASLPAATVGLSYTVAPDVIAATASFDAMGAEISITIDASTIAASTAVPEPTVAQDITITVEVIAATTEIGATVLAIIHTFHPPVAMDLPSVAHPSEPTQNRLNYRLFRHYGPRGPRGRTVIKANGTYTTVDYPTQDQLDAADIVYLGGHVYTVDADEAAELIAAGYGDRLS